MDPIVVGYLGIGLLVVLFLLGIPIAFSFGIVGFMGILYVSGLKTALATVEIIPYAYVTNSILTCVPMFILMGYLAFHSGISRDLYVAAYKWFGRLPGGLAVATMGACAGFAAATGVSSASAAAMGAVALPEMRRYGYDDSLATGTVAVGGTLGILIPPSTAFILYGLIAEQSIGKLFIAGIIPGILVATCYMILILVRARLNPRLAPQGEKTTWKDKFLSLRLVFGILVLMGLVMGGLWGGIFTPTEAGALGALGAMLIYVFRRGIRKKELVSALTDTIKTTAMIFCIVIGAMIFSNFLAYTELPMSLAHNIANLALPPYAILILILILYIPLGMFMDPVSMVLLTIPIFVPIIGVLGFNMIWFGVIAVRLIELGLITPPVGLNCFVIAGVAKDVPLSRIFRGILPFIIMDIPIMAVLVAFPQISLFLPNTMK
jgi:tripartite ATP-independent transporter DctM subunit